MIAKLSRQQTRQRVSVVNGRDEEEKREAEMREAMKQWETMELTIAEMVDTFKTNHLFIEKVAETTGVDIASLENFDADELAIFCEKMDADRSGKIDFNEFTSGILKLQRRKRLQVRQQSRTAEKELLKAEAARPVTCSRRLRKTLRSKIFYVGVLAFFTFWFGVYMCTESGDMDTVTAMYVMGQVITTVGYGDTTPQTDVQKLCVSAYSLLSLVIIAYAINEIVATTFTKHQDEAVEAAKQGCRVGCLKFSEASRKLAWDSFYFFAFIMFGTFYYAYDEKCTCGYGQSRGRVEGCQMRDSKGRFDYDLCVETGGLTKTVLDCFYMSIITLSTVGFGDYTPASFRGRCVGLVWMSVGVAVAGNWVTSVSSFIFESKAEPNTITREVLLEWLDRDQDDKLSRAEHHLFWLATQGVISEDTLEEMDLTFDGIGNSSDQVPLGYFLAENGEEFLAKVYGESYAGTGDRVLFLPGEMPPEVVEEPPAWSNKGAYLSKKNLFAIRKAKQEKQREEAKELAALKERKEKGVFALETLTLEEEEIIRRPPPCTECGLGLDLSGQPVAMSKGTDQARHAAGTCVPCPHAHGELGCPDQELCTMCHFVHLCLPSSPSGKTRPFSQNSTLSSTTAWSDSRPQTAIAWNANGTQRADERNPRNGRHVRIQQMT
eukprot:TRINITY_DN6062_c0_g3_i1.p1 TRINITY_DN6062_c0_g3~~TRINITY_DN6062_c0_g3_i1.p1  ORF type:complete len:662 (+),score=100.78 TRINITY_DN6062_c0_g3_i1:170-2155(+)